MNEPKSIIVEIPILDSIDEMKVVNTFTEEQLWYVCAIAKAFEKTQSNWNSLREFFGNGLQTSKTFKENDAIYEDSLMINKVLEVALDKMNELEGVNNSE